MNNKSEELMGGIAALGIPAAMSQPSNSLTHAVMAYVKFAVAGFLLCLLGPVVGDAQPTRYNLVDLGTLGGDNSWAFGINEQGHVAGTSDTVNSRLAFLHDGQQMHDLGTLAGGGTSYGYALNDLDEVVGSADQTLPDGSGAMPAFLYRRRMTSIGTLGGGSGAANSVNNSAQIAGTSSPDGVKLRAFLFDRGAMHDLGTLGGTNSWAQAVNAQGYVVGGAEIPGSAQLHVFLYKDGVMQDLGTLSGGSSLAFGINRADHVVGRADLGNGQSRAFLYDGTMRDLGALGAATDAEALAINNSEVIVGDSGDRAFIYRDGIMTDLNSLATIPQDWRLVSATGINERGQISVIAHVEIDGRFLLYRAARLDPIP